VLALMVVVAAVAGVMPGEEAYLGGREAERQARYGDAVESYCQCAETGGPLSSYARLRVAGCRARAGNADGAILAYTEFIGNEPEGPWTLMAKMYLGLLYLKEKRAGEGLPLMDALLGVEPHLWWFERRAWQTAEARLDIDGERSVGLAFFASIAATTPFVYTRRDAARLLSRSVEPAQRLAAARGLLRSGYYTEAGVILNSMTTSALGPPEHELPDADLGAWASATPQAWAHGDMAWWKTLGEYPFAEDLSCLWLVHGLRKALEADDLDTVRARCHTLRERHAEDPITAEAHWWLARHLERKDREEAAADAYLEFAQRFAAHEWADGGYFSAARLYGEVGKADSRLKALHELRKELPKSDYHSAACYFCGLDRAGEGDEKGALDDFREAAEGSVGEYYAHRALQRLHEAAEGSEESGFNLGIDGGRTFLRPRPLPGPAPDVPDDIRNTTEFQRLYFFGQHGLEEGEWEALAIGLTLRDRDHVDVVYQAMAEAGLAHTALELADAFGWGYLDNTPTPARQRLTYPRAYWPYVCALAEETRLDPYLLLAVARQESTFRPALSSSAGARGVMQVMPDTATWLAKVEPAVSAEHISNLDEPANSLRLGAYYLMRMVEHGEGNLVYALAAYNAGPGNARKWRQRYIEADLDTFVELIPFRETRSYVKAVLANYAAYHSLYPPVEAASVTE